MLALPLLLVVRLAAVGRGAAAKVPEKVARLGGAGSAVGGRATQGDGGWALPRG